MFLLYLDDSGSVGNASEEFLVLGGVCVWERQVNHFTLELDKIAARLHPTDPDSVEFHASEIFSRRVSPWNALTRDGARDIIKEVLGVLANAYESARAFACVVHKASCGNRHPMEVAFEDIVSRFDLFLGRANEKGIIILDESTHATKLLDMARQFRRLGTQWHAIRHIVDGPLFVTSRAFRCVQVADHVAYAAFRRYEAKDATYLDVVINRFDSDGKILHGLRHIQSGIPNCMCPACLSRR